MPQIHRRTATKVRSGQVRHKNRWRRTDFVGRSSDDSVIVDRRRPGPNYVHVVTPTDVKRFIRLIPDWEELKVGLRAILIDSGSPLSMGWHNQGTVAIRAWNDSIEWTECDLDFYEEHREILLKLGVPATKQDNSSYVVHFTRESAKAFMLIHVLVHELGHHRDRMMTKAKRCAARGEDFAEQFARKHEDEILARYMEEFDFIPEPITEGSN